MKTKTIIMWVLGTFSLLILFVWIGSKNTTPSNNPNLTTTASTTVEIKNQLVAPEIFYDFGTISMKNGNVSKIFKVTNSSDKDIFLSSLTTSCMCTKAFFVLPDGSKRGPFGMPGMGMVPKLNETIKIGESRDVEVVYDPNAHGPAGVGMIDRFVYLEDSKGEKLQFEIKAVVTP